MVELVEGLRAIALMFVDAANRGEKISRETAELMAMIRHTSAIMLDLVEELTATPAPNESAAAQREAGMRQLNGGAITMFNGAESSLSERSFYAPADLSVLLKAMNETLPRFAWVFSENVRAELRRKFEKHRNEFTAPDDRRCLDGMIAALAPASPKK